MKKYFCDVCENEITTDTLRLGTLDFGRGILEMCSSCSLKLKGAKAQIYNEYKAKYDELDSDYLDDIKEIILTEPEPQVEPTIEEQPIEPRNIR